MFHTTCCCHFLITVLVVCWFFQQISHCLGFSFGYISFFLPDSQDVSTSGVVFWSRQVSFTPTPMNSSNDRKHLTKYNAQTFPVLPAAIFTLSLTGIVIWSLSLTGIPTNISQYLFYLSTIFRRAFFVKSSSGVYKIDKGQKVVGNCHLAQRDPEVFGISGCKSVNEFDPSRFNVKVSVLRNNPLFSKQLACFRLSAGKWAAPDGESKAKSFSRPYLILATMTLLRFWEKTPEMLVNR